MRTDRYVDFGSDGEGDGIGMRGSLGSIGTALLRSPLDTWRAWATAAASLPNAWAFASPGQLKSGLRWPRHHTKSDVPNDALFMHCSRGNVESGMASLRSRKNFAASGNGICPVARVLPSTNSALPDCWTTMRYPVVFVDPVLRITAASFGTGR